ncbi:MAG: hypothetical protein H0X16_10060 [Chloroflexi bacterium]|nr:hypothetical protein [Chloroflexota bacterium]
MTRSSANVLRQNARLSDQQLGVEATYTAGRDHIRVDGAVTSLAPADTAFQVTYTLPVDAKGWKWGDYARRERTIGTGRYAYITSRSLQQTSRYPFSVVSSIYNRRASLSLAMPLEVPRIARMEYGPAGLSITFDLAVSPAATLLGPRATFSFVLYTSEPEWGFRAATAKYYQLFPSSFERRTNPAREGGWFFQAARAKLAESYDDFGLGLNTLALGKSSGQTASTWGADQIGWSNERGIYTSAYNHHWAYYLGRPERYRTPTYQQTMAALQAAASAVPTTEAETRSRDEARAALVSTARDFNGRLLYEPYSIFLAFFQTHDDLGTVQMDWPETAIRYQSEGALTVAAGAGGQLDAIHLDSTSGMKRWGAADDYHRPHWARTTVPLTFSYHSGLVTERGILSMMQQLERMAQFTHDRGMFLSANFNAGEGGVAGYLGANFVDYFGIERGLPERADGSEGTTSDSFAMLKRSMAYQRPVSTFDYLLASSETPATEVEARLQQNLFYGFYAGGETTSELALATDKQAVFARYTPLMRELSAAGWEPVTRAHSSNPSVWLERFGDLAAGNLNLTLRNESEVRRTTTVTVDLAALGGSGTAALTGTERLGNRPVAVAVDATAGTASFTASLPAGTTRLITLAGT